MKAKRRGRVTKIPKQYSVPLPMRNSTTVVLVTTLLIGVNAGPCDIYHNAGTPCVAAHSTVRALYDNYTGPLYSVNRSSDSAVIHINVLEAGGFADSAVQDRFCASSPACTIQRLFDQSPQSNHLDIAPGSPWYPKSDRKFPDHGVNASRYHLT